MCSAVLPITRPITSFHKPRELSLLSKRRPLASPNPPHYTCRMRKRVCYIHVGPHKSGTTSIQWFLQENRAEFLKQGCFVPESETKRGAHHALAKGPAGLDLGQHRQSIVTKSVRAIAQTSSDAIIIFSEALEGILDSRKHAEVFFGHIRDLNF